MKNKIRIQIHLLTLLALMLSGASCNQDSFLEEVLDSNFREGANLPKTFLPVLFPGQSRL